MTSQGHKPVTWRHRVTDPSHDVTRPQKTRHTMSQGRRRVTQCLHASDLSLNVTGLQTCHTMSQGTELSHDVTGLKTCETMGQVNTVIS